MLKNNGKYYAEMPESKPANSVIHQLDPVQLPQFNGIPFCCWKMTYQKTVDTGKKDKNGKKVTKIVMDTSKPAIYDPTTSNYLHQQSSYGTIIKLISAVAKQKLFNVSLMNKFAQLLGGKK